MNKTDAMTFECLPACNGARWCGGLFVNDSATNPLTHDWNKVLLPYHDGGSFAGDNATVTYTTYGGKTVPLYFRGHRNFLAAINYLVTHAGLNESTEVILTGNSAGGLATYYHMDELTELLPHARVVAAPDSGFFFADDPEDLGWPNSLLWMVKQFDSLGGLDKSWWGHLRGDVEGGAGSHLLLDEPASHPPPTCVVTVSQRGLPRDLTLRTAPFLR